MQKRSKYFLGKSLVISVIVSVYNSEKFLPQYLKFVNEQFCENFEIIFVDAKSTDFSVEIIKNFNFRKGISPQILLEKSRVSIYQAWNIAIKASKGEYIVNWNTDDILFPSALQTYKSYCTKFPDVDLFYGGCFLCREQKISSINNIFVWPEYNHQVLLERCICGPFPLVKKSAIKNVGFFDENYISSGDYDMWLRLSKNNYKFKRIPEIVGSFLDRPDSVSKDKIELARQEDIKIQKKYA